MTKRWLSLSLFLLSACLPHPEADVQKARPELSIKGRIQHSSETFSGPAAIYVERSASPEAVTADDGSFAFSFAEDRLEALRLQYGLQNPRLHLYFVNENGSAESAVVDTVDLQYRGALDLGAVLMQPETEISGRVIAAGSGVPLENARIWLGRKEFTSAADGTFKATIPAAMTTPFAIEKKGFVQTKGTWQPGGLERSVELYGDMAPAGSIEALPRPRTASNNTLISLNYSATGSAFWVRFANNPGTLMKAFAPEAPWMDLSKPLSIDASDIIYYQFADKDQKIFSSIQSYTPAVAAAE